MLWLGDKLALWGLHLCSPVSVSFFVKETKEQDHDDGKSRDPTIYHGPNRLLEGTGDGQDDAFPANSSASPVRCPRNVGYGFPPCLHRDENSDLPNKNPF